MAGHGALILAMLFAGPAGAAAAVCPAGGWCAKPPVEAPPAPHPKPPPAKPAIRPAPRPRILSGVPAMRPAQPIGRLPTVHVGPGIQPPVSPEPPPAPSPPATGPLFIHREEGGYTRHYGGAAADGSVGVQPSRDRRGAAYHYRGRSYAPFFAGNYQWPHGRRYHRLHAHERMPRVFLIAEFFIDDYADYGFGAPPPGTQWVRYGPDLVLVFLANGDILQVIPGVFAGSGDPGAYVDENGAIPLEPPPAPDQAPPPDEASSPDEGPSPS